MSISRLPRCSCPIEPDQIPSTSSNSSSTSWLHGQHASIMIQSASSLALVAFAASFLPATVHAGTQTLEGCFSSLTGLTLNSTDTFNSRGYCGTQRCLPLGYEVFAMGNSSMCYCSNTLPPADTKVDDDLCSISCPGYPSDVCMYLEKIAG